MKVTVCLICHGETDWNKYKRVLGREDIELNQTGRIQAKDCVEYLSNLEWDGIFSSPMKRAKESAEIIGVFLGLDEIIELKEFTEKDYGEATGMKIEEKEKKFGNSIIFGEESDSTLIERALKGLEVVLGIAKEKNNSKNSAYIILTHTDVICSILNEYLDAKMNRVKEVGNCTINLLVFENGKWHVEIYNKTSKDILYETGSFPDYIEDFVLESYFV